SVRRPRVYLAYFVTEDRVSSGNHFFAPTQRIGFLVAVTGRQRSARAGAPPFHLRHFLLFADYAAAAEAEKVAGDAERVEKRRPGRHQRRSARDDSQPERRCAGFARAA